MKWNASLAAVLCLAAQAQAISLHGLNRDSYTGMIHNLGPQAVNLWKLASAQNSRLGFEDRDLDENPDGFRAQWFQQPLDHFDSTSQNVFNQRYWVNTRHYKARKGAPVILLDGGISSGEDRLPILDTGIAEILAKATDGIAILLEHRYYGQSLPVNNLSTDALRFLNNEQAVEDNVNFMKNVKPDGIQEDLTAPGTPWIYYGGGYSGARAAHMKILHPELVWGAIASSAPTQATFGDWGYFEIMREAADSKCSDNIANTIRTMDDILSNSPSFKPQLKNVFGLEDLEHDEDFATVLISPLDCFQYQNWDPKIGNNAFDEFCEFLKEPYGEVSAADMELPFGDSKRIVSLGQDFSLDVAIVNFGKYIKENVVANCTETAEECFGSFDDSKYQDTGLDEVWRLWIFQQCTQWGLFSTAPPDQNMPRIVTRLLTLEFQMKICKQAYPPGEYFSVPAFPNITAVNALGGFNIAADRLAIIDGEDDPWRSDSPLSDEAPKREDTILRPFKLIPDGVLHYDQNGLKNILDEPIEIRQIHEEMIAFVNSWLNDWNVIHGIEE